MDAARSLKLGSFFMFVLASLFCVFFMHAKHDSALAAVNAFANDPYDAIGSFGIQAAAFLGILCLVRAFRRLRLHSASVERQRLLLRTQTAAVLSVGVTLVADAVAMLRYPSLWIGKPAGYRLLALFAGMTLVTSVIGVWIHRTASAIQHPANPAGRKRAVALSVSAALLLFFYPPIFSRGLIGVLLTAFVGTVILFVCMWAWTLALVPATPNALKPQLASASDSPARIKYRWAIVILVGILIGLFFVAGEASEGAGIPQGRLALVVSAYLGLETAGIMVGYGFLGRSLSLLRHDSQ